MQWNPSNVDTIGTGERGVLISGVKWKEKIEVPLYYHGFMWHLHMGEGEGGGIKLPRISYTAPPLIFHCQGVGVVPLLQLPLII